MEAQNRLLIILGAGESGVGAAILGKKMGWRVFVSESGSIKSSNLKELKKAQIDFESGGHDLKRIMAADLIIKSPGIAESSALMQSIRDRQIKVISEIEFAGYYSRAKHICITGSNGKTTTALWCFHILKKAGLKVGLAGNIGQSFAKQIATKNHDIYVLELSSFQLDDMYQFKADIAILTNITPDHLDRYNYQMSAYVDAKFRIIQNQTKADYFIFNQDDLCVAQKLNSIHPKALLIPFSLKTANENGGYANEEQLYININKQKLTMSIHELALKGKHNTQNALAAGIAARLVEIRTEIVRESLQDFVNVEHRMEFVAKVNGIEFINDSKATNVNSAWFALESMDKPTIWIVGGVDKGNDYSELEQLVVQKVKAIVCLGTENAKIISAFKDKVEVIVEANSANQAVAYAYELARKDETVLLSPACASFDLFSSYEDRGQQFKQAVRML